MTDSPLMSGQMLPKLCEWPPHHSREPRTEGRANPFPYRHRARPGVSGHPDATPPHGKPHQPPAFSTKGQLIQLSHSWSCELEFLVVASCRLVHLMGAGRSAAAGMETDGRAASVPFDGSTNRARTRRLYRRVKFRMQRKRPQQARHSFSCQGFGAGRGNCQEHRRATSRVRGRHSGLRTAGLDSVVRPDRDSPPLGTKAAPSAPEVPLEFSKRRLAVG